MATTNLFELLSQGKPVIGPGIWDALSAKIAQRAGFELVFLSGYGLSASLLGEPDFGLITQTQAMDAADRICSSVTIPVIVDIDTGYGGPFNVERAIHSLLRSGAAGCFLEDQLFPKRCGHMERKQVVGVEDYLPKLRAALRARGNAPFHVTARTDALSVLGIEEAIRRAKLYRDTGADAVFVEAPRSVDDLKRIRDEVRDVTLVANMVEQGKTPILPVAELFSLGFSLVAVPVAGLLATSCALTRLFASLQRDGTTRAESDNMHSFHELNQMLGLDEKYRCEQAWRGNES
ncbi:MAG TPA: isocitrate lyase/PEP mutase family protein [Polyangiaceae bacterium]|nr:isocitrate lyase/PEP mutase family protein [Polyangiaceae bacterium]